MLEELGSTIKELPVWAEDEPVAKTRQTQEDDLYIHSEPLGVVLVIGAWNYPFNLTIQPMVGAIAAGTGAPFWRDCYRGCDDHTGWLGLQAGFSKLMGRGEGRGLSTM